PDDCSDGAWCARAPDPRCSARSAWPSRLLRSGCRAGGYAVREKGGLGAAFGGLLGDGGGPFIKRLPFGAILKQDCESRSLWQFGIRRSDAKPSVGERRQARRRRPVARLCPRVERRRPD